MNNTMQETSNTYTAILDALMTLHNSLDLPRIKASLSRRCYVRDVCTFGYEGIRQTGCTIANLQFLVNHPNAIMVVSNKTCYEMIKQLITNSNTVYSKLPVDVMERIHTAMEFSMMIDGGKVPDKVSMVVFDCNKHTMPRVSVKRYYDWVEHLDKDVITLLC